MLLSSEHDCAIVLIFYAGAKKYRKKNIKKITGRRPVIDIQQLLKKLKLITNAATSKGVGITMCVIRKVGANAHKIFIANHKFLLYSNPVANGKKMIGCKYGMSNNT